MTELQHQYLAMRGQQPETIEGNQGPCVLITDEILQEYRTLQKGNIRETKYTLFRHSKKQIHLLEYVAEYVTGNRDLFKVDRYFDTPEQLEIAKREYAAKHGSKTKCHFTFVSKK
jgi:hypothetical protein